MNSSFCENPHQRPGFDEIRDNIKSLHASLIDVASVSRLRLKKNQSTTMKHRYMQLHRLNREIRYGKVTDPPEYSKSEKLDDYNQEERSKSDGYTAMLPKNK